MGWDIQYVDENGDCVKVDNLTYGSTVAIGGSDDADMSLTWNYSPFYFRSVNKDTGLRWINLQKGEDVKEVLEKAVKELGTEQAEDYWADTPGNAGHALSILLRWIEKNPKGIFHIS